ncbi:hypothetical protein MKW94_020111 [Papaver nudicaule]|uniref:Uncharacterized protein n=1 Tax=Papaver nudicaule TaxID=74823 RepID=A0AA41VZN9_PAPNU|nr:hypothetical protein [Papaver nudicaule]
MGELGEMISKLDLVHGDPYMELVLQQRIQPIFKVPNCIKERNKKAYEPQMVSIGPYYYGKKHLIPMQVHKRRALIHFLRRQPNVPAESYTKKLKESVKELRESYEQLELMETWQDDDRFVQLMLVDGVFLLEFLSVMRGTQRSHDYANIDPIFGERGHALIYNSLKQDLLLLENQLPYQVLSILLSVSGVEEEAIDGALSWIMFAPRIDPGCHLLDMYMKGLLGGSGQQNEDQRINIVRHSASALHKYGVQFKTVGSYDEIRFNKSTATLKLPPFEINEYSISTFLNLKAYELRGDSNTKELSSYIQLLDTLVESANDVSLLRSRGIIVSSLASDDAVVEVMKELKKDTLLDGNCNPSLVLKEVNEYVEGKPKWSWFLSYWRSIVGAATFLLVLTLLQTVYSILSFHLCKEK